MTDDATQRALNALQALQESQDRGFRDLMAELKHTHERLDRLDAAIERLRAKCEDGLRRDIDSVPTSQRAELERLRARVDNLETRVITLERQAPQSRTDLENMPVPR
jgi:uncharacterized protein involved in exopolysaccharide biosynthesis